MDKEFIAILLRNAFEVWWTARHGGIPERFKELFWLCWLEGSVAGADINRESTRAKA